MAGKPKGTSAPKDADAQAKADRLRQANEEANRQRKELNDQIMAHAQKGDLEKFVGDKIQAVIDGSDEAQGIDALIKMINDLLAGIGNLEKAFSPVQNIYVTLRMKAFGLNRTLANNTTNMQNVAKQLKAVKTALGKASTALASLKEALASKKGIKAEFKVAAQFFSQMQAPDEDEATAQPA